MPNHCYNRLALEGPAETVASFVQLVEDDEGAYAILEKLIPMPKAFENSVSGSVTLKNGQRVSVAKGVLKDDGVTIDYYREFTDEERTEVRNVAKTLNHLMGPGIVPETMDWYSWCNAVWGTKWGDYDITYHDVLPEVNHDFDPDDFDTPEELEELESEYPNKCEHRELPGFLFDTAWSPIAKHAMKYISKMFPDIKFIYSYWEKGMQVQGEFIIQNGELLSEFHDMYDGCQGG